MATPAIQIHHRFEDDPARGFSSHVDFLTAVMANRGTHTREDVADIRLRSVCTRYENDSRGADVAFLLPRAFTPLGLLAAAGSDEQGGYSDTYGGFARRTTTATYALGAPSEGDPTAGRTRPVPMDTPYFEFPARADKDHSTSVSGGLSFSRKPEALPIASSRMGLEKVVLKATSLIGLAFATEELLTSTPTGFGSIIGAGFSDELGAHLLREKIRGLGGDQFEGVLNSPARIPVAKEPGQAADTIVGENVVSMRARCWGYGRAIWLSNHDCYEELAATHIATPAGAKFLHHESEREGEPDTLSGRPIFYTEHCSTLGDEGDLILVNWFEYLEGLYQPLRSAESVHVRFENHERALKFWIRNAGAPWWRSALTTENGAATLSPIVTLAERA